ncbi:MAG: erythromycin esterase family protein, partial [Rhodothermales bacterium]|nr:erythromycin esterase family protein [Rhodothermales bacterium]
FEEPGTLEEVAALAADFFLEHLGRPRGGTGVARRERRARPEVHRAPAEIAAMVGAAAEPFDALEAAELDGLLERIGDAEVVLLGEASHGTSEFYRMRQRVTQALVERSGFRIVAAEADWPDAERVDEYVRGRLRNAERPWEAFSRFPTWMWRNEEVLGFIEWLRGWNDGRDEADRAGFYGLDLYSLYTSVAEVLSYLEAEDPDLARTARTRYGCLAPFEADPALYGRAVITQQYRDCEGEAVAMLQALLKKRMEEAGDRALFDATQNARVVRDAEQYYRVMFYGSPDAWNLRDTHMMQTLKAVRAFHGGAKAVVWAHNSHLGDAAATQMGQRGEINVGHLCREAYGDGAYLVGFGTHAGTVAAAPNWGAPVETMRVRPSHTESYERLCHDSGVPRFVLPLRHADPELRYELGHPRLERAIGVVYRPETELQSHYFAADLPKQFDEYVWFDETEAVRLLGRGRAPALPPRHPFRLLAD